MKKLLYIVLFIHGISSAQVGQTASQIALDITEATIPVTSSMVSTNLSQQAVLKYSKNIAAKTAGILVMKEFERDELTNPNVARFEETTPWRASVIALAGIGEYNANSLNVIENFNSLNDFPLEILDEIIEQATLSLADIQAILKGGKENRMSPAGRYKLIQKVNKTLMKLYLASREINGLIRSIAIASGETEINMGFDRSEPLNDIYDKIDNIILD